jgi:L-threonylcarbamoyladenylate synthase
MGIIADEAKKCVEVMRKGGVILYPTDTVWGIGCDATNAEAVKRVYEIKRRADNKALLLLVDSADRISRYVANVPMVAWDLIELTDKPLTIIYDGARNLAPNLIAEDGSVGIRVTSELFSKELCYRFQKAVVSTSANVSGEPTPRFFAEISPEIIDAVDYVVNYKQLEKGSPKSSSIIKLKENGTVTIIRE